MSKLTESDVLEIRRIYVKGSSEFGCRGIARRYGVDHTQIHNIVTGKQWAHLKGQHAD